MDFSTAKSRPFTAEGIARVTAGQIGVYGIFRADVWVYVGKGDIKAELARYLNGENPRITAEHPTTWCAIVTDDCDRLEKALILKYRPIANQRGG